MSSVYLKNYNSFSNDFCRFHVSEFHTSVIPQTKLIYFVDIYRQGSVSHLDINIRVYKLRLLLPFSHSSKKFWYRLRNNNKGKLLPQRYRHQFASKQIVCVEYYDLNDDAEREIFQACSLDTFFVHVSYSDSNT